MQHLVFVLEIYLEEAFNAHGRMFWPSAVQSMWEEHNKRTLSQPFC
jgi:hypothetical protein